MRTLRALTLRALGWADAPAGIEPMWQLAERAARIIEKPADPRSGNPPNLLLLYRIIERISVS